MNYTTEFERNVIKDLATIKANQVTEIAIRKDHEKRLRSLEHWKWKMAGGILVAGVFLQWAKAKVLGA